MVNLRSLSDRMATLHYDPSQINLAPTFSDEYRGKDFGTGTIAEWYHENTKLALENRMRGGPKQETFTEPEVQYAVCEHRPDYPAHERIDLPDPAPLENDFDTTLFTRRSRRLMAGEGISRAELATLLDHSLGETERSKQLFNEGSETAEMSYRSYPSGGGLYPIEPYLLIPNGSDDLDSGTYYYTPEQHALRVLERENLNGQIPDLFSIFEGSNDPRDASVVFVLTANFPRTTAKYGPRGYRLVLQESGHIAQNIVLVSEAMGLHSVPLASYRDGPLNDHLNLNGVDEAVVYTVSVGSPAKSGNKR